MSLVSAEHDFGILRRADQRFADFAIENETDQSAMIFRVEVPKNVDVTFSSKTIEPGQTEFIRIQFNPLKEGLFREEFPIYLSAWQEPRLITVSGESTFSAAEFIPCPDFDQITNIGSRPFHISVIDRKRNPLESVMVSVFKDGQAIRNMRTDINGESEIELTNGFYYFNIGGIDTALFVGSVNSHLVVELDQLPGEKDTNEEVEKEIYPIEEVTFTRPKAEEIADSSELPSEKFKPNNLVFLVDVSTSMKHNGKLDLLKISMIQLVAILRDYDKFTLISFSTESGTLIKTEQNLDRDACKRAIGNLKAGGKTAGTKALADAGKAAFDFYIQDGNNQIVVATDGSFNEGADKALKLSSKFKRKGVVTSVIGIKCGKFATNEMNELASAGGGNFIPINNLNDAELNLIKEVKFQSVKEPEPTY